tara:strand:- start:772 stop:993 length:222 start_codon:yes stop_codon:yes gene_type:complete
MGHSRVGGERVGGERVTGLSLTDDSLGRGEVMALDLPTIRELDDELAVHLHDNGLSRDTRQSARDNSGLSDRH